MDDPAVDEADTADVDTVDVEGQDAAPAVMTAAMGELLNAFFAATKPCSGRTPLFFGGHTETEDGVKGGPRKEQQVAAAANSRRARRLCMQCPLQQMRTCALFALQSDNSYGVWAGVQLPGNQTRKVPVLMAKRKLLAQIAAGTVDPRAHESNADLFEPHHADELVLFPGQPDRGSADPARPEGAIRVSA